MKTILRNFLSVLRRFKMATALNVLGLSVAFAAFLIIMMQVDYDYSFDRSHPHADRIFRVEMSEDSESGWKPLAPRPLAEAFISSSPHILGGTFTQRPKEAFFSIETPGGKNFYTETVNEVSPGYAGVFTFDMLEGSVRALDDPDKALIPESLARKLFGSEPATGRRLEGQDKTYTVGGVFRDFPRNASATNAIYAAIPKDENLQTWNAWNYTVYIRTDEPENVEGLYENFRRTFDFSTLGESSAEFYGKIAARLTPLTEVHYITGVELDFAPKASRQTLLILSGIALLIILIAGINYMNFSTALAPKRIRSINTQKVLGGSSRMIRFALLTEAVSVALVSYLAALWLVSLAKDTFVASLTDADISLSAHTGLAALTGAIALATGILAGIRPAWYMTSFPPALALKGSFGLSPEGRQLRNTLTGVQFIASFALIIGASFMYLQNHFMRHTGLGFAKDRLIVAGLNGNIKQSIGAFTNQLKSFSGVEGVCCASSLLSGEKSFIQWGREYHDKSILFQCMPVDVSFLDVMGIEVAEGRGFRPEDAGARQGAYVFNEKARRAFGLTLNDRIGNSEIIGFIPDVKIASLHREAEPMAFYVWGAAQSAGMQMWGDPFTYAYIRVKAGSDMAAAIEHVRATLTAFDDTYPFDVRFFDEVLDRTYRKEQNFGTLISLFSLVAILISIVGVFGLAVFESEYRRKEISLRKIFGSTTGGILVLFNKVYLRILALCFVAAAPVAWYAVNRWLENFAYRTPLHWWVYPAAFALVALFTMAVVTFQNWRAANANPVENIKAE